MSGLAPVFLYIREQKKSDIVFSILECGGGKRQRVKLAQNIKKKGNIYIPDEPTTGLHAADIEGRYHHG